VHALVLPVLLRRAGLDQLRRDPELDPPRGERREAAERRRREGHAVVAADARGQAVRAEQALEDAARPDVSTLGSPRHASRYRE
jgi:hypothetical protein